MPGDWIRVNDARQTSCFFKLFFSHVCDRTIVASVVVECAVEHCLQSKPHAIDLVHRVVIVCLFNHFDEFNGIGWSSATAHGL